MADGEFCHLAYGGSVRIACVGGGPAGLYFSLLTKLWQPESDVIVFERNKEGATHGWGVTMEQKFLAALAGLDGESAAAIEWRSVRWLDQAICFGGDRKVNRDNGAAYGISRQRFVEIVAARARQLGVEIRYEHTVRDIAELTANADLIVAADGIGSQIRDSRDFGTTITEGRNKYIWLGTGRVFDSFSFLFERTRAGWIWAYAYRHDPQASTFIVECQPRTWTGLGFHRCSPARALDRLEDIFAGHLAGHRLWAQFPDGMDAHWQNFRTVRNERWHRGNVALVGDSAHTAHFSVGLGTTLALEDVIVLAGQLRRTGGQTPAGVLRALQAYQDQRQAELRAHAIEARHSARWFENVPRYAGLTPRQFATVLHARRAPLLPVMPPRLFCGLQGVRQRFTALDQLRALADR